MTSIPFPPTIYEGYYHTGRSGWVSCEDSFSEDLGICTAVVAEQADRFDAEWIVRRTDHDPDTSHAELTRDFQTNALIAASYERDAFFLHA